MLRDYPAPLRQRAGLVAQPDHRYKLCCVSVAEAAFSMLLSLAARVLQDPDEPQPADDPQPHPVFLLVSLRHTDLAARKTMPMTTAITITYCNMTFSPEYRIESLLFPRKRFRLELAGC